MPKIYYCDRCGIKYSPTDHCAGNVELRVYNSNHSSWPDGEKFGLCPGCTKKLTKFLENR